MRRIHEEEEEEEIASQRCTRWTLTLKLEFVDHLRFEGNITSFLMGSHPYQILPTLHISLLLFIILLLLLFIFIYFYYNLFLFFVILFIVIIIWFVFILFGMMGWGSIESWECCPLPEVTTGKRKVDEREWGWAEVDGWNEGGSKALGACVGSQDGVQWIMCYWSICANQPMWVGSRRIYNK